MTVVADLMATLRADSSNFVAGVNQARDSAAQLQQSLTASSSGMTTFGDLAGIAGTAIGGAFVTGVVAAIDITKNWTTTIEGLTVSFDALMGHGGALNNIDAIEKFSVAMGLSVKSVGDMSRSLEIMTDGMHNTEKDWKNFADVAAGTGKNIDDVAYSFSRVFQLIQKEGQGSSRAITQLVSQGLLPADTANQINEMVKNGATLNQVWDTLSSAAGKFQGAAQDAAGTLHGLVTSIHDMLDIGVGELFTPIVRGIEDLIKHLQSANLTGFTNFWNALKGTMDGVGQSIAGLSSHFTGLFNALNGLSISKLKSDFDGMAPVIGVVSGLLASFGIDFVGRLPVINRFAKDFRDFFDAGRSALIGFLLSSQDTRDALINLGESILGAVSHIGEFISGIVKAANGFAPMIAGAINFAAAIVTFVSHNQAIMDMAIVLGTVYEGLRLIQGGINAFNSVIAFVSKLGASILDLATFQKQSTVAANEAVVATQSQSAAADRLSATNVTLSQSNDDVATSYAAINAQLDGLDAAILGIQEAWLTANDQAQLGIISNGELGQTFSTMSALIEETTAAYNDLLIAEEAAAKGAQEMGIASAQAAYDIAIAREAAQGGAGGNVLAGGVPIFGGGGGGAAGGLSLGGLFGAGVTSLIGGQIGNQIGSAIGGSGGGILGSVLGGAGSGAIAGALMGGITAPVGAAVGALVGLGTGLMNMANHADNATSASKRLSSQISDMENTFNRQHPLNTSNISSILDYHEAATNQINSLNDARDRAASNVSNIQNQIKNFSPVAQTDEHGNLKENVDASGVSLASLKSNLKDAQKAFDDADAAATKFWNDANGADKLSKASSNLTDLSTGFSDALGTKITPDQIAAAAKQHGIDLTQDLTINPSHQAKDDLQQLYDALSPAAQKADQLANAASTAAEKVKDLQQAAKHAADAWKSAIGEAQGSEGQDFFTVRADVGQGDKYIASLAGMRLETVAFAQEQLKQFDRQQALINQQHAEEQAAQGVVQAQQAITQATEANTRAIESQRLAVMTLSAAEEHFTAVFNGQLNDYSGAAVLLAQLNSDQQTYGEEFNSQLSILNSMIPRYQDLTDQYKSQSNALQILKDQQAQYQDLINRPLRGSTQYNEQLQKYDQLIAADTRYKDQLLLSGMYDKDPAIQAIDARIAKNTTLRDIVQQTINLDIKPKQEEIQNILTQSNEIDFHTALDAANNLAPLNAQVVTLNQQLATEKPLLDSSTQAYNDQKAKVDALYSSLGSIVSANQGVKSANDAVLSSTQALAQAQQGLANAYFTVQQTAANAQRMQLQDTVNTSQQVAGAYQAMANRVAESYQKQIDAAQDAADKQTADAHRAADATIGAWEAVYNTIHRTSVDSINRTIDEYNRSASSITLPMFEQITGLPQTALTIPRVNYLEGAVENGAKAAQAIQSLAPAFSMMPFFADGAVKFYAPGGYEDHTAHIANTMRVFAEPETGGEAYIPLAISKRTRSENLLKQVADIFGYQLVSENSTMPNTDSSSAFTPTRAASNNSRSFTVSDGAIQVTVHVTNPQSGDVGSEVKAAVTEAWHEIERAMIAQGVNR